MKPASFAYHRPTSLKEALDILAGVADSDGRILAGGQSLAPMMAYRIARPAHLVDINGVEALKRLAIETDRIAIGAGVRHAAFERLDTPGPTGHLLGLVARHIAHHPIRTRGCFCGSLAHADPASEWCLVAATLAASLIAHNRERVREITAHDFFTGILTTDLLADEILVEARLPLLRPEERFGFCEFSRRAGDFAVAMVLVTGVLVDGLIREARVGVGGAESVPRRLGDAEARLEGETPSARLFRQIGEEAAKALLPLEDPVNPADYRRDLVRALVPRALEQAFA